MGWKNAWKLVAPWLHRKNLFEDLSCERLVIEVSMWFHLFLVVHAAAAAADNFNPVKDAVLRRCEKLIAAGITPILVFDGAPGANKAAEKARRAKKVAAAQRQLDEHASGVHTLKRPALDKAVVTVASVKASTLAFKDFMVRACRENSVAYVVSPREADHQMVHMVRQGQADAICSVDADTLLHEVMVVRDGSRKNGGVDWSTSACTVFFPKEKVVVGSFAAAAVTLTGLVVSLGWAVVPWLAALSKCDYLDISGVGPGVVLMMIVAVFTSSALLASGPEVTSAVVISGVKDHVGFAKLVGVTALDVADAVSGLMGGVVYDIKSRRCVTLDGSKMRADNPRGPLPAQGESLLIALGLRCTTCSSCTHSSKYRHDVGDMQAPGLKMRDSMGRFSYDMESYPEAFLTEAEVQQAARSISFVSGGKKTLKTSCWSGGSPSTAQPQRWT